MSAILQLVLSIIAALPQEIGVITSAVNTVKSAFSAKDQATLDAILSALNAKVDGDVSQLDADAAAHGG